MSDLPILCIDFDGVIHRYDSGWKGPLAIPDDVTEGFFEWLDEAANHFKIVVYSSRCREPGAIDAMMLWIVAQRRKWHERGGKSPHEFGEGVTLEFVLTKPAAFVQIDDRALTFNATLLAFKPWNRRP